MVSNDHDKELEKAFEAKFAELQIQSETVHKIHEEGDPLEIALFYVKERCYEEALPSLEDLLLSEPENVNGLLLMGRVCYEINENFKGEEWGTATNSLKLAHQCFRRALQLDPSLSIAKKGIEESLQSLKKSGHSSYVSQYESEKKIKKVSKLTFYEMIKNSQEQ